MTKLDQIIWNTPIPVMVDEVEARYPIETIKEIAIAYAKLCLEKAAKEAKIKIVFNPSTVVKGGYYSDNVIDKESITNIELP